MNIVQILMITVGLTIFVALIWAALTGPSPAKEGARRLQAGAA